MLAEIYPRAHVRYAALPILGPHLDSFVEWLHSQGYPRLPICLRVRAAKPLDALLRRDGVAQFEGLSAQELLAYAPASSQDDIYRSALARALSRRARSPRTLAFDSFHRVDRQILLASSQYARTGGLDSEAPSSNRQ